MDPDLIPLGVKRKQCGHSRVGLWLRAHHLLLMLHATTDGFGRIDAQWPHHQQLGSYFWLRKRLMIQARPPSRVRSFAQPGTSDWRATDTSPRLHPVPHVAHGPGLSETALGCCQGRFAAAGTWKIKLVNATPRIHKSRYATSNQAAIASDKIRIRQASSN